MRGLPSILSLFRNEFNRVNNAAAQMLDFIYDMILEKLSSRIFWCASVTILTSFSQRYNERHCVSLPKDTVK